MADNNLICVICSVNYAGYGNDATPVADGYCCDDCNFKVIVARIKETQREAKRAYRVRRDAIFALRRAEENNKRTDEDAMEE